ncbi:unnamed protein product [Notodromas monacha]|uniref:DNA topoisomerase 2 n=1 Tax=Notodromas monacha TaxID=399045 RepID=A0A7R9GK94_9CRUS|nr:unnamed protein product [Notodromas monacha]CAG0924386.1 unnamed protein product [Notodromas monacha]
MTSPETPNNYDNIQTLDGITQMRVRPGMWIGDTSTNEYNSAPMNMLREVVGNSCDEFLGGHATEIEVTLKKEHDYITVRDNGRGIPFGWNEKQERSNLEVALGVPNSGAKYDKGDGKAFKVSIGLNGVGTKAVTALSEVLVGQSTRDGVTATCSFHKGFIKGVTQIEETPDLKNGTSITWLLDQSIIPFQYRSEHIHLYLKQCAYLNAGLKITFNDKGETTVYHEPEGIYSLRKDLVGDSQVLMNFPKLEGTDPEGNSYEIALAILATSQEEYQAYVNGGAIEVASAPVVAMRKSLADALLRYLKEQYPLSKRHEKVNFTTSDVRSGTIGVVKILHTDPKFDSQTKTKLTSTEISSYINQTLKENIFLHLITNPVQANQICDQIIAMTDARQAAEKAREASLQKSKSPLAQKKQEKFISLDIYTPPLSEDPSQNILYLFEGQSASGSLVEAAKERNPVTGELYKEHIGILALKGIGLNSLEVSLAQCMKNVELSTLVEVTGLSLENPSDLSGMKYNEIWIATDEDGGGYHITTLLLTFFVTHFPEKSPRPKRPISYGPLRKWMVNSLR